MNTHHVTFSQIVVEIRLENGNLLSSRDKKLVCRIQMNVKNPSLICSVYYNG